jgi:putative beta-lysine N-acetyltransferase
MKLDWRDAPEIVERLERLADVRDYGKIFCKVPAPAVEPFVEAGFVEEASIPGFFTGRIDAAFMSGFRKSERAELDEGERSTIEETLELALVRRGDLPARAADGYRIRRLREGDASRLAGLYRIVFRSYPFRIFDPDYLRDTMAGHIRYYGAFQGGRLVAASSAETDRDARNTEMTDFATAPEHRGHGLAARLLLAMERDMKSSDFQTAYTIARATSPGMNVTFARCGYDFAGTLVNNTQIAGRIESMNVWHKNLFTADRPC